MRLTVLLIGLIWLTSCSLKHLKPTDYIFAVVDGKACYYKTAQDLAEKKNVTCKEFTELNGWLVIHPSKMKEIMNRGLDELFAVQQIELPKPGNGGVIYSAPKKEDK